MVNGEAHVQNVRGDGEQVLTLTCTVLNRGIDTIRDHDQVAVTAVNR